tara:strand:- start:676 stop:1227 length:552 start_codon:yes stop_codon:yes gene_type:complete
MGGRCFLVTKNPDGSFSKTIGPECTDNFQIVENGFEFNESRWHSVEQAFQALKFPSQSIARNEIFASSPKEHESDEDYGLRVWQLGQYREDSTMREDWQENKVKVMLLLNIAKYASDKDFQNQLLETIGQGIEAQPSTSNWTYWNSKIQLFIRKLLIENKDLAVIGEELSLCSCSEINEFLEN